LCSLGGISGADHEPELMIVFSETSRLASVSSHSVRVGRRDKQRGDCRMEVPAQKGWHGARDHKAATTGLSGRGLESIGRPDSDLRYWTEVIH
jgi:hypothetical protein